MENNIRKQIHLFVFMLICVFTIGTFAAGNTCFAKSCHGTVDAYSTGDTNVEIVVKPASGYKTFTSWGVYKVKVEETKSGGNKTSKTYKVTNSAGDLNNYRITFKDSKVKYDYETYKITYYNKKGAVKYTDQINVYCLKKPTFVKSYYETKNGNMAVRIKWKNNSNYWTRIIISDTYGDHKCTITNVYAKPGTTTYTWTLKKNHRYTFTLNATNSYAPTAACAQYFSQDCRVPGSFKIK